MTVSIFSNTLAEIEKTIRSEEEILSKASLSRKDEAQHAFNLAKMSALKTGTTPGEIRRWEQDRLLAAAGLPRMPEQGREGHLPEEVEEEWNKFTKGREVRSTHVPSDDEIAYSESIQKTEFRYTAQQEGTQSVTSSQGAKGGYFVAPEMSPRLYNAMKQYDSIFDPEFSNIVESDTGGAMPFPVWSDVSHQAVLVSETTQSVEVMVAPINSTQLAAYSYRSQIVAVSNELLKDSGWPIGTILEKIFALRLARGVGQQMITGSGVNQPTGLLTAATGAGATIVVASGSSVNTGGSETGSNSIGTADVGKLYAALDPAYRSGAKFYCNDATLQYLNQLIDKNGRPIVDFSTGNMRGSSIPQIWGIDCAICPSMPTFGAGRNSMCFANPLYFIQRRVPSATYVRAFRQATGLCENDLTGFEMWARFDSNLVSGDSNFVPAAILQNHS
jgi:HK97 family phage major capsid protein